PVNVDPVNNRLDDPEERERVRRVYERGLGQPVGYVLPIQRGHGKSGPEWQSGIWMLRSRHLFLLPGDSPVGFRLPLQSLPWEPPDQVRKIWLVDPMAPVNALPDATRQRRMPENRAATKPAPEPSVVRTAMAFKRL